MTPYFLPNCKRVSLTIYTRAFTQLLLFIKPDKFREKVITYEVVIHLGFNKIFQPLWQKMRDSSRSKFSNFWYFPINWKSTFSKNFFLNKWVINGNSLGINNFKNIWWISSIAINTAFNLIVEKEEWFFKFWNEKL